MARKKYNRKRYKRNYIEIKNSIRKWKADLGGLFDSHGIITGENQWIDFYFLGKKKRIIWNADIITAKLAYEDKLKDIAYEELDNILGPGWFSKYQLFAKPIKISKDRYELPPLERKHIKELGGLTWTEWLDKRKKELADTGKYPVYESVKIDTRYKFGIGLHIVKNIDGISIDTINNFIKEFLAHGEQEYRASEPLTFSADEIPWMHGFANAIRD